MPAHSSSTAPAAPVMSFPMAVGAAGAIAGMLVGKAATEWRRAKSVEAPSPERPVHEAP